MGVSQQLYTLFKQNRKGLVQGPATVTGTKHLLDDGTFAEVTSTGIAASQSETNAGTEAAKYIAPLTLHGYVNPRLASRATAPYLYFDGSTTGSRAYAALGTAGNLATSPLTLHTWVYNDGVAKTAHRGIRALSSSDNTSVVAQGLLIGIDDVDGLLVLLYGATTSDFRRVRRELFSTSFPVGWHLVSLTWDRLGAPLIYVDGALQATSAEETGGTPPAWTDAIASAYDVVGITAATDRWRGGLIPVAPINRVQTAAEILAYAQTGRLPDSDAFGAGHMVPVYSSDFSAGVYGATIFGAGVAGATLDGNIDGIGGEDNVLRYTDGGASGQHTITLQTGLLTYGVRYRISGRILVPSSNVSLRGINNSSRNSTSSGSAIVPAVDTWTDIEYELTGSRANSTSPNNNLAFSLTNAAGAHTGQTFTAGDIIYFRDFVVTALGPVADWQVQPGGVTLSDSKANRIPLLLTPGVTAIGPKPETVSVLSQPMTADGFVLADQVVAPVGYKLVDAVPTQTGTSTTTLTIKETSSGGTTVATGALSASAPSVDLTVSNGILAGGKKLHVAAVSWTDLTVQIRFNFRRIL